MCYSRKQLWFPQLFCIKLAKHVIDLTTHSELDATCGQVTQIASSWSLDLVVRGSQSVAELGASSVRRAHDGRVVGQLLQHLSESWGRGVAVSPSEGAGLPTLVRALTARVRHGEDCGQGGLEALRLHAGTVRVEHDGDVPYDAEGREGRSRWHRHRRRCNRRAVWVGGVGWVGGDEVARAASRARAKRERIRNGVDGRNNSGETGISGVSSVAGVARVTGVAGVAGVTRIAMTSRISGKTWNKFQKR